METDVSTKKRIEWIDALKGFLIVCVTIGHCNVWPPLERYIYSFHMLVFFAVSGFLFSAKPTAKEMLMNRIKKDIIAICGLECCFFFDRTVFWQ